MVGNLTKEEFVNLITLIHYMDDVISIEDIVSDEDMELIVSKAVELNYAGQDDEFEHLASNMIIDLVSKFKGEQENA